MSKIEWTNKSWNPITGCTPVSEGCRNCYARRMAQRLKGRYGYPMDDPFRVTFHPDRLNEPSKWLKPRMVFVCSMGDLFHYSLSYLTINEVIAVIGRNYQHIFQILTKRPERALEFYGRFPVRKYPNVWLGVSVENQKTADERIPILLQIPAAVHFVSYEPALEEVNFTPYLNKLDWLIAGGESGPGARPAHPDWFRKARDQCVAAGVPFFFKQWGEWAPSGQFESTGCNPKGVFQFEDGIFSDRTVFKVGRCKAGRLLDGKEWSQYPEVK